MISAILANGEGSRFKNAGIDTPKHLLPLEDGRPVIAHIADTLPWPHLAIVRVDAMKAVEEALEIELHAFHEAMGVLKDAKRGLMIYDSHELLINLCDCWMPDPLQLVNQCRGAKAKAGVVTFSSNDPRHDYLAEGMAFGGIYYFAPGVLFECEGETLLDAVLSVDDYYVHNTYQKYIDIGVPEDYNAYLANHTINI